MSLLKESKYFITLAGVCLASVFSSCGFAEGEVKPTVTIDGSSTVFPISRGVAEKFQVEQSLIDVNVGTSGTGGGFKKFMVGDIDINNASRPIKSKEIALAKENGVGYLELAVAFDGITVVVNKDNTWLDYLTPAELKKIWEPGSSVKLWSDVRSGWPSTPISLYGPGRNSGTFDFFTESIVGKSGHSRSDYTVIEDGKEAVEQVVADTGSMSYMGYAHYAANKEKLKVVPIDSGDGAIDPTTGTIYSQRYKPLSRPLFIYINLNSLVRPEVQKFVEFYLNNVSQVVSDVGYVRLSAKDYRALNDKVKSAR